MLFFTAIESEVLLALFAALVVLERASTANRASSLINGIAIMLLIIFIDSKILILADDVIKQRGSYSILNSVLLMLIIFRLSKDHLNKATDPLNNTLVETLKKNKFHFYFVKLGQKKRRLKCKQIFL
ncbi:lipid II flippase family protein [Ferdinandcohnia quinoae]|uniref:lipid II flippase family protein n=1 Tax=Fredinandcohnia quinoae TaxID=2918902 RepID=UPI0031F4DFF6